MVWLPRESPVVDMLAVPFDSETVPSVVDPSVKITLPVGVPPPGDCALTVAVNVTLCPKVEGFGDAVRTVDVAARFTTWVIALEVLVLKLLSSL
jgi:hypothetical protein